MCIAHPEVDQLPGRRWVFSIPEGMGWDHEVRVRIRHKYESGVAELQVDDPVPGKDACLSVFCQGRVVSETVDLSWC